MSKLQPVYYVSGMQICLLSTEQILQSVLRVEDNKQIIKTHILKYNISNPVSLTTRCLDFETLYYHFGHASDEVICHILDNVENVKKICFQTQKYICYSYILRKIYQYSFSKNSICSSDPLELIHSDFLELSILSYSKYKQVITFLDDYFSYCNIAFLYKKSEATEAIKSIL